MTPTAAAALTYRPAYVGLFAALLLAAICNAYLDIGYGTFGFEVLLWGVIFGLTLRLGWRQRGEVSDSGRKGQKIMLLLGLCMTVLIFIPMWGFPRAGLALLAMLQAAQNCVTVTRRQLHLGLLVSAVMVMFAASHHRADWTMLFYLVPYLAAAVFTLVAEQISRRAEELSSHSLAPAMAGGQGAAIAAATGVILLLGLVLYLATPQPRLPYAEWDFGLKGRLGKVAQNQPEQPGRQSGGRGSGGTGQPDGGGAHAADGDGAGWQYAEHGWPTPAQMREAARRRGMPQWQRNAINGMADAGEWLSSQLQPRLRQLQDLWQAFKEWLRQHLTDVLWTILLLAALALLLGLWRLVREARSLLWLATRLDYLRLGVLGWHGPGSHGARRIYHAVERLFELSDMARARQTNVREYLHELNGLFSHLQGELEEMTRLFEDHRYGRVAGGDEQVMRMRELYRRIYRRFGILA